MRPISFQLLGTSATVTNSRVPVTNWTFSANLSGGSGNVILLNHDPNDDAIVVGSSVSAAYQISGSYSGTVTGLRTTPSPGIFVTPNLADNILANTLVSGTNVNAGGTGQSFIGVTSLTGIEVGDVVTGSASIPVGTTVTSLDVLHTSVFLSNALTGNIAPGVAITFTPSSALNQQLVPLDVYVSPQNVQWASYGGTVTANGYVGPLTNLVNAGAVTSPIINGAYTAINFTNSGAGTATVIVNESGITT